MDKSVFPCCRGNSSPLLEVQRITGSFDKLGCEEEEMEVSWSRVEEKSSGSASKALTLLFSKPFICDIFFLESTGN